MQKTVSINDAAAALSVSRGKLYGLIASGDLATVRIGRRHLVQMASIDALIAANTPAIVITGA